MDNIRVFEQKAMSEFSVYMQDKEFGKPGNV